MIMLIMMIIEFNTYQYYLNYKLKHPKLNYGPDLTLLQKTVLKENIDLRFKFFRYIMRENALFYSRYHCFD